MSSHVSIKCSLYCYTLSVIKLRKLLYFLFLPFVDINSIELLPHNNAQCLLLGKELLLKKMQLLAD
jgi:hypothetical protein